MELYLKQGRYREIIDVGRTLEMDHRVLPSTKSKIYAKLMYMIGDAFLKQDFLYDASTYYEKSLAIDSRNLEFLLKLRASFERYNDERMISQLDEMIGRGLSPKEQLFEDYSLQKGKRFSHWMGFDGKRVTLKLNILNNNEIVKPLVSVFFNDKVVWENYVDDGEISVFVRPLRGKNRLVISPVNTDIVIQSIAYQ
jgi:hypothetical protein